jgi:hypothetical protein
MKCQSCRIEIEELEMGGSLTRAASAHLDTCSPCGAFYNERLSLRRLVGSLEPVPAPPDFEFRLRARLAASTHASNHRFSLRSFIASAPAIGLAATFALLLAGVAIYTHFKSGAAPANQPSLAAERDSPRQTETNTSNTLPASATASVSAPQAPIVEKKDKPAPVMRAAGDNGPRMSIAANNRNSIHQPRKVDTNSTQIISNELGSRSAPKITPAGESPSVASANPLLELPVRSPSQPVKVFVNDRTGGQRTVTLEPVIFGSQDFIGRNSSQRLPASQGIW